MTDKPVLVTGANGFISLHVIEQLLKLGYKVRGTVRSLDPKKVQDVTKLDPEGKNLELVKAELVNGAFDDAVKGCEYVLHIASPFIMDIKDAKKDLVEPAIEGTLSVLNACLKSDTIKKVVVTSSVAGI